MKTTKWISVISDFRILLLVVFVLANLAKQFVWFKGSEIFTEQFLRTVLILSVIAYVTFYIAELKLVLKEKNKEIQNLKDQLIELKN